MNKTELIKKMKATTSLVEFYKLKEAILKELEGSKADKEEKAVV